MNEIDVNKYAKKFGTVLKSINEGLKGLTDIQVENVTYYIEKEVVVKKSQYTTESNVERIIANQLEDRFGKVHRQYSIGGYLGLKCDIDIHDGKVGIEIKLANQLTTSNIERLFGQILYYSRRTYKQNLIVLVVGTEKEADRKVEEIADIINELGLKFIYLEVTK